MSSYHTVTLVFTCCTHTTFASYPPSSCVWQPVLSETACLLCQQPDITAQERQKLLTFVVVGGGPTGVEVAAELYDLVRDDLRRFYPDIWRDARVCLVELQDHVLSTYDRRISDYTSQLFSRQASLPVRYWQWLSLVRRSGLLRAGAAPKVLVLRCT